jgi:hypothetical protein
VSLSITSKISQNYSPPIETTNKTPVIRKVKIIRRAKINQQICKNNLSLYISLKYIKTVNMEAKILKKINKIIILVRN